MRLWRGLLAVAIVGLLAPLASASHTVDLDDQVHREGEEFVLEHTIISGKVNPGRRIVSITAVPVGIVEFEVRSVVTRYGERVSGVVATCTRLGSAIVTVKYSDSEGEHTVRQKITCTRP